MNEQLITDLIKAGSETTLRNIRSNYDYPIKNGFATKSDIELCARIDNYFIVKKFIDEEIRERCAGLTGQHEIVFEHDYYTVFAIVNCNDRVDSSVGLNETDYTIISLTIEP